MKSRKQTDTSRRNFLRGVSTTLAGVAVAGTMGYAGHAMLGGKQAGAAMNNGFPYKKLDPDKAAEKAFEAYMTKGG